ncbi:MAG: choice-of-anchor J domain-containing protein [Prevotella sp.]|nr:choice-of-anchor J domain-containing protein [Prevotella sp.]
MKQRTLLSLTLGLLASCHLTAQTTYFKADFEQGMPEGMTFYDLDQKTPSSDMQKLGFAVGTPWIVTAPADEDGNHVATSTSWYKTGATSNDWMILPALTISDAKAKLQWRSRASDKDYRDGFVVYCLTPNSSTSGQTGADLSLPAPFDAMTVESIFSVSKEAHDWQLHEIDLSTYVDKIIYLAFVNNSKDRTMLYVDDVFVGIPSKVGLTMNFDRCFDGAGEVTISGQAVGTGHETVSSFTIGFEVDGQTIHQTYTQELQPGKSIDFTLPQPVTLERNHQYSYRAWIEGGGDRSELTGKFWAIPWKLVCEEVTGTWCQYCVRGLGAMNYMREHYHDGFIGIGIHNDGSAQVPDSMAIDGEKYLNWVMSAYSMGGFPNCVMNRNSLYAIDPGNIPYFYENIKKFDRHEAGISATASYDAANGQLNVKSEVLFTKNYEEANFRLFYVVIENNVHRTHAETGILNDYCGYDQINGYAGSSQECFGFEKLPSIVNADNIWYNDVARGTWPKDEFRGLKDIFPKTISEGDLLSYECSFPLPAKIHHIENCEVVVMLLDKDGHFLNADNAPVQHQPSSIQDQPSTLDHQSSTLFDLQGRHVSTPLKPGLYIRNGRKFMHVSR